MGPGKAPRSIFAGALDPSSSFFPLVFFIPLGLLAFGPCFFGGQAFFDGDLITQYVPMRIFLRDSILHGSLPLWCPYLLGGQPFFADPNTQSAYPLTYLALPFPAPLGFMIFFFLHFVLGSWGMSFWCRSLGLSNRSGILAGVLTSFSGFFWWEIIHPPLLAAFAWFPWWGGALEKWSQKLEPSWAFCSGFVFALLFLSGNYQMTLGAAYGGGLYFFWGAAPLLVLWIPSWEFLRHTSRFHETADYASFQADLSLAPADLKGLLLPVRCFGPSGEAKPIGDYLVNAGYFGPWGLFLAALAFRKRDMFHWFLGALGLVALLTATGKFFPLHRLLCRLAPGFDLTRAPFRFLFLYILAGVLLTAIGLEELEKGLGKKWKWGAAVFGGILLVSGSQEGKDAWPVIFSALLGLAGLLLWKEEGKTPLWVRTLVMGAMVLPVLPTPWLWASSRLGPVSNFDYLQKAPILSQLKEKAGLGRVLIGDKIPYSVRSGGRDFITELPPDSAYVVGLRNALGYNPLVLESITDIHPPSPTGIPNYMKLRAVKTFASGDPRWRIEGFSHEQKDGLVLGDNQETIRYIYAPDKVASVADKDQRLALMSSPQFDPYRIAFVSEPPPPGLNGQSVSLVSASLEEESVDHQSFHINVIGKGLVVFSESMYPGWKAWVNGKPVEVLTANHSFRGIVMEGGENQVDFRYEPAWGWPLLLGFLLWLFSLVWRPWREPRTRKKFDGIWKDL